MGVGLVSERCGLRTEHIHAQISDESEQGSAAWGACVGERGAAAAAARRCMAEVQGGWHAFESYGLLTEADCVVRTSCNIQLLNRF